MSGKVDSGSKLAVDAEIAAVAAAEAARAVAAAAIADAAARADLAAEAAAKAAVAAETPVVFVSVTKGGVTLEINPATLAAHRAAGWKA